MALTRRKGRVPLWATQFVLLPSTQPGSAISKHADSGGFKWRWHDRHQAPFYRADHAVKIRLEGTGSLPKRESIAELWYFSQGAFGK